MASQLHIESMAEYRTVVYHVLQKGTKRSPRGEPTYDAGQVTVVLDNPTRGLALGTGRGLNPRIAAVEAIQLMGAFHDPKLMTWASPNFEKYMDGDYFWGAYGTRVGHQVELAVAKLENDPETRQAVVTLWDPQLDNEGGKHDYPCTVAFGFAVRRKRLVMNTVMRSNDVWLGFPYDVFQFTQLQLTVAAALGLEPGPYTHTAWSMHVYERDVLAADRLLPLAQVKETWCPAGLGMAAGLGAQQMRMNRDMARHLTYNSGLRGRHRELTESEVWYRDVLSAYSSKLG